MGKFTEALDRITLSIGRFNSWSILLLVVTTAMVALLRSFFNLGWIWLQESLTYLHSLFFLGTVSLGLLKEGHVRVDIFYRIVSPQAQARIDLFGSIFLLIPFCLLILTQSFGYVLSSWVILEGSPETGGIPATFILKSLIILFSLNLLLQSLSQAAKAMITLTQSKR